MLLLLVFGGFNSVGDNCEMGFDCVYVVFVLPITLGLIVC